MLSVSYAPCEQTSSGSVCVCSMSVKLLVSRLRQGACVVCLCSLSVELLVSLPRQGVCVCALCQLTLSLPVPTIVGMVTINFKK